MNVNKTQREWLEIHNRAAGLYINSEWSREVLFGVAKKRRKLFSLAVGNVLDVGCGYGMNFPYLTKAEHSTGMDFSPVMLAKARSLIRGSGATIDLREGNAETLDFADDTFDTVISTLGVRAIPPTKTVFHFATARTASIVRFSPQIQWIWVGRAIRVEVPSPTKYACPRPALR